MSINMPRGGVRRRRLTAAVIMRDDANKWISATVTALLSADAVKRIDSAFANLVSDLNCH